jgi:hypothetical protein
MPHWFECICGHRYDDHDAHPDNDACRYETCACDCFICDHDVNDRECEPTP